MATKIENEKGFLIIELTPKECIDCNFGIISIYHNETIHMLVCDDCNDDITIHDKVYYIAVLNRVFCKKCYEYWIANATYYPEDRSYEIRNYDYYANILTLSM